MLYLQKKETDKWCPKTQARCVFVLQGKNPHNSKTPPLTGFILPDSDQSGKGSPESKPFLET